MMTSGDSVSTAPLLGSVRNTLGPSPAAWVTAVALSDSLVIAGVAVVAAAFEVRIEVAVTGPTDGHIVDAGRECRVDLGLATIRGPVVLGPSGDCRLDRVDRRRTD